MTLPTARFSSFYRTAIGRGLFLLLGSKELPCRFPARAIRQTIKAPPLISLKSGYALTGCLGLLITSLVGSASQQLSDTLYTDLKDEISFVVSVPPVCQSAPCGLIVDVHGGTMNAAKQDAETNLRYLGEQAPEFGAQSPYIVLQPELLRKDFRWNRNDLKQILAYVNELTERFEIRPDDRHFGGFSQGGVMAAWLLCSNAGDFVSYSAIAGGAQALLECFTAGASPSFPLLYIHGRNDRVMPFTHAQALAQVVAGDSSLNAGIKFHFHDLQGGLAGSHCVPGGEGRFGCGTQSAGEQIIQFYIAQSKLLQIGVS